MELVEKVDNSVEYNISPTGLNFVKSDAYVQGIMGPVGSGKSSVCVAKILKLCQEQKEDAGQVRRSRWAIVRNTYSQLETTTLKTWEMWVPKKYWSRKGKSPIQGMLRMPMADGTTVEAEIWFLAVDRPSETSKLLSMELTGIWFNEAREMYFDVIKAGLERVGRFPQVTAVFKGATWHGGLMDTNPPDDDHWWYQKFEKERPETWDMFRQPGGILIKDDADGQPCYAMNPLAENIPHLKGGYNYYFEKIPGNDPEYIKVMLMGNYGVTFTGRPVYGAWWDDAGMTQAQITYYPGMPLYLGWDFGMTPACVVGQLGVDGQCRILREYFCEDGALRQFAQDTVLPALSKDFPGAKIVSNADPAGMSRVDTDASTCIGVLNNLGIQTQPAVSNLLEPRRQAVVDFMTRSIMSKPGFIVDRSCAMLRKGFNGGYQFDRVLASGSAASRYKDVPNKSIYSHPHDALQYLCMAMRTGSVVAAAVAGSKRGQARNTTGSGWRGY